ncbi:MAG: metal-dependent transcriptional regulator [Thermoplasmatales archaeon]|nr:metal-dependent transcriptional regulator [Thermoplasmatales archaeon]
MKNKRYEEYIETVYGLVKKKGTARTNDIAKNMKVRPSTATEMLQKMEEKGYIKYTKYRGAILTEKGRRIGRKLEGKHYALRNFFVSIGVDEKLADEDACKIEHVVSNETLNKLTKFLDFIQKSELMIEFETHENRRNRRRN